MSTPFITTCTTCADLPEDGGVALVHLPQLVQTAGISTYFSAWGFLRVVYVS